MVKNIVEYFFLAIFTASITFLLLLALHPSYFSNLPKGKKEKYFYQQLSTISRSNSHRIMLKNLTNFDWDYVCKISRHDKIKTNDYYEKYVGFEFEGDIPSENLLLLFISEKDKNSWLINADHLVVEDNTKECSKKDEIMLILSKSSSYRRGFYKFNHKLILENIDPLWQYKDYNFFRKNIGEIGDEIIVTKNGEVVFEESNFSKYSSFLNNDNPIADITGNGIPDVVIDSYTGGAHCCNVADILELGEKFRILSHLEGYHMPIQFENIDKKPGLEIIIYDSYAYLWTFFSGSAFGKVILRYQDGSYVMAPDLMEKPPLRWSQLKTIVKKIKSKNYNGFCYTAKFLNPDQSKKFSCENLMVSDGYFANAISDIIDLIYSKNYPQAMKIIDQTWPGTAKEKMDFKQDLINQIEERAYGKEVIKMNYEAIKEDLHYNIESKYETKT